MIRHACRKAWMTMHGERLDCSGMDWTNVSETLRQEAVQFVAQLDGHAPGLTSRFPVAAFAALCTRRSLYDHYENLPRKVHTTIARMHRMYGRQTVSTYVKLVLCTLIQQAIEARAADVDSGVADSIILNYQRIMGDFASQSDDYYQLDRPRLPLEKDLAISSGRAIPIGGAWLVEKKTFEMPAPHAVGSVAREAMKRRPFYSARIRLGLVSGQVRTCFVVHTIDRHLRFFNAAQHHAAYLNLAELVLRDRGIEGIYRASWFLDPALEVLSPGLQFLRQIPLEGGAEFQPTGPPWVGGFRDAVEKSATRKQAHADGRYEPWVYSMYWSREDLLRWAADTAALDSAAL